MDVIFGCPFTMLVCGSSGSGKSSFTRKLLATSDLLVDPPRRIVWCYGVAEQGMGGNESGWRSTMNENGTTVEYHHGLPTEDMLSEGRMICVIHDLMTEAKSSSIVSDIYSKHSHHNNITCFLSSSEPIP
jgi:septin family protein